MSDSQPFVPRLGVREIEATYEMLVKFKTAILQNSHWTGTEVQAVAMGLQMVVQMESQYRAQLEMAKASQKEAMKQAKESVNQAGGKFNGEVKVHGGANSDKAPTA